MYEAVLSFDKKFRDILLDFNGILDPPEVPWNLGKQFWNPTRILLPLSYGLSSIRCMLRR